MREHEVNRRLVKSPPELWAVCSEASLLAKHLDAFGEITITRLEPERTVVWEGETASGTVCMEPAGWGTRVTVTATVGDAAVAPTGGTGVPPVGGTAVAPVSGTEVEAPTAVDVATPTAEPTVAEAAKVRRPAGRGLLGLIATLLRGGRGADARVPIVAVTVAEPPAPEMPPPAASTGPEAPAPADATEPDAPDVEAALEAVLESLGRAHHRPYSRS